MSKEREHIEKIRKEKFWLDEKGQLRKKNPLINDLINSIERLSENLYSKDTHFIFELIQNAEDNYYNRTKPSISFRLVKDDPTNTPNSVGALIVQNNELGFSLDNVDAICAIGKTTKNKIRGYIGEKGIGFKSVFNITTVPYIFSNGYQFCFLEKDEKSGLGYIVPYWVVKIPQGIDPNQTTIILPLTKNDFGYEKIREMLQDIEPETILFLSKLKKIHIKTDSGDDFTILKDDTRSPHIQILIEGTKEGKTYSDLREMLIFTKPFVRPKDVEHEKRIGIDKRDVTIAFPTDSNKNSIGKIFAYLPVRSNTGLPFLINADFILPSSREDIQDVSWNRWLMKCLANLLSKNLQRLKEKNLLTVQLLETLAKRMNELDENSMFYPIAEAVRDALLNQELLPADDGTFVSARNAKLASGADLRKLLTYDQLRELFQSDNDIKWLSGEITTKIRTSNLRSYLISNLDVEEITADGFARRISSTFLANQTDDWFIAFYKYLSGHRALWRSPRWAGDSGGLLRRKSILRLQDNRQEVPFRSDGMANAYLPPQEETDFPVVKRGIANNEQALEFLNRLPLSVPDVFDDIVKRVLPKYSRQDVSSITPHEHAMDNQKILRAMASDSEAGKKKVLRAAKNAPFLKAVDQNGNSSFKRPDELYFPNEKLKNYFSGCRDVWFLDETTGEKEWKALGVENKPRFKKNSIDLSEGEKSRLRRNQGHTRDIETINYDLDGLENFLVRFKSEDSQLAEHSLILWKFLLDHLKEGYHYSFYEGEYKWFYYHERSVRFNARWKKKVVSHAWLPKAGGIRPHKPPDLSPEELPESFIRDEKLADLLEMQKDEIKKVEEKTGGKFIPREEYEEYKNWKKQKTKTEKAKDSPKTETDTDKIYYKDELQKSFNRPGETELPEQAIDTGKVSNPGRRREKSCEEHKKRLDHEPMPNERHKETMRAILEGPDEQVREYLFQFYGGKCQICSKTFPDRNGNPFFIANYIVPKKLSQFIDTPANALCLCADHFAKWQHGAVETEKISVQIENFKVELEGGNSEPVLRIKLCGEECKIKFKEKHLLDLQELLRASETAKEE